VAQPIVQLKQLCRMAVVGESKVDLPTLVLSADFKRNPRTYRQQQEAKESGLGSDRWAEEKHGPRFMETNRCVKATRFHDLFPASPCPFSPRRPGKRGPLQGRHPQEPDFLLNYSVVFSFFSESRSAAGLQPHEFLSWTTHEIKAL